MGKHESGVNFQKLIQDLADMYPFEVPEVVVVELVANSLDAGATRIAIDYDSRRKVLAVEDNGRGMDDVQFDEYHDFAAGLKTRGSGIGFAGVGAKISFNVADRVTTETRSTAFLAGSDWYLESGKRLVWEDIRPTHLSDKGTRVEVHFRRDAAPSFTSTENLIELLRRHYLPLLDTRFLELYEELGLYRKELQFAVNGQTVATGNVEQFFGLDKARRFFPKSSGKRVGYGVLGLSATEYPLGLDSCGVLVCTHGKVVKAELFNQFPGTYGPRLFGLVKIPQLANHLTTSKTNFIRSKGKYREFERLYDPLRQEFKAWLGELEVQLAEVGDAVEAAKLERELRKLVEEVPELSELFGFRSSSKVLQQADGGDVPATSVEGVDVTFPVGEDTKGGTPGPVDLTQLPQFELKMSLLRVFPGTVGCW